MPYRCKTCGSLQVYHHCIVVHPLAAAPTSEVKQDLPVATPPKPSSKPSDALVNNVHVAESPLLPCSSPLCDNKCGQRAEKTLRGLRRRNGRTVRVNGDSLCMQCYEQLKDVVKDHIPCPPGWPGGYYVARMHSHKKVKPDVAITLLWCHGRLLRAAKLKEKGRVSDVEVSTL